MFELNWIRIRKRNKKESAITFVLYRYKPYKSAQGFLWYYYKLSNSRLEYTPVKELCWNPRFWDYSVTIC